MRTSWGSPSLENFNCSTPPHLAAALLAKLSMEMGTGLRFGKKKLSNRDSPCRRQSWAGRQVLGVKRAGLAPCKHKATPHLCLLEPPGARHPTREAHHFSEGPGTPQTPRLVCWHRSRDRIHPRFLYVRHATVLNGPTWPR